MNKRKTITLTISALLITLSLACRFAGSSASPTITPASALDAPVEEMAAPGAPTADTAAAPESVPADPVVQVPTTTSAPVMPEGENAASEPVPVDPEIEEPPAPAEPAPTQKANPTVESDTSKPITPQATLSGAECLVGTWEMDNASYKDFLNALATYSDLTEDLEYQQITGGAQVTFSANGMVSNHLDGLGFIACSAGNCMDFTIPSPDVTTFTYHTESEVIQVEGGQIVAANFSAYGFPDDYGQTTNYACSGDTLSTAYEGLPAIRWARVE